MLPIVFLRGEAGSGKDSIADVLVNNWNFKKIAMADPLKRFAYAVLNLPKENLWGPSKMRNERIERVGSRNRLSRGALKDWISDENLPAFSGKNKFEISSLITDWYYRFVEPLDDEDFTARSILQTFGTECGRNMIHKDIWVNKVLAESYRILSGEIYRNDWGFGTGLPDGLPPNGVAISDGRFVNEILAVKKYGGITVKIEPKNQPIKKTLSGANATHQSELEGSRIPDMWYDCTVVNDWNDPEALSPDRIKKVIFG